MDYLKIKILGVAMRKLNKIYLIAPLFFLKWTSKMQIKYDSLWAGETATQTVMLENPFYLWRCIIVIWLLFSNLNQISGEKNYA